MPLLSQPTQDLLILRDPEPMTLPPGRLFDNCDLRCLSLLLKLAFNLFIIINTLRDLSSPYRDRIRAPCSGSLES